MTTTTPTPALADLPEHRLDYIARQYFADEQYQQYVKHAISDAFQEARRAAQPVAPSPQIAEVAELSERQAFAAAMKEAWPGTVRAEDDEYWTGQYGHIWRSAIAASRRAAGGACAEMRELCPNCGGTGEVHRTDGEYLGTCDCMFQTLATPAPASAGQAAPAQPEPCLLQEILDGLTPAEKAESERIRAELRAMPIEEVAAMVRGPVYLAAQPAEGAGQAGQVALDTRTLWTLARDWVCAPGNKRSVPEKAILDYIKATERAAAPAEQPSAQKGGA